LWKPRAQLARQPPNISRSTLGHYIIRGAAPRVLQLSSRSGSATSRLIRTTRARCACQSRDCREWHVRLWRSNRHPHRSNRLGGIRLSKGCRSQPMEGDPATRCASRGPGDQRSRLQNVEGAPFITEKCPLCAVAHPQIMSTTSLAAPPAKRLRRGRPTPGSRRRLAAK